MNRDSYRTLVGVFIFTYAALFSLHITTKFPRQALHQVSQFQHACSVQRRTPRCRFHERISFYKVRPRRWNLTQLATIILKVHVALGIDTPVLDEIKLPTF